MTVSDGVRPSPRGWGGAGSAPTKFATDQCILYSVHVYSGQILRRGMLRFLADTV